MNDNDLMNERVYRKFQPTIPDAFALPAQTRVYLEYDEAGSFWEYAGTDKATLIASGILEKPEKDLPVRSEAA